MAAPRTFPRSLSQWRAFALEHFALTVTTALLLLTVLHILVVSRFNLDTAAALTSVADRAQLLVATLTFAAVVLMAIGIFLILRHFPEAFARALHAASEGVIARFVLIFVTLLVTAAIATFFPVSWIVLLGLLMAATQIPDTTEPKMGAKDFKLHAFLIKADRWILPLLLTVMSVLLLAQPWVPRENIKFADGTQKSANVVGSKDQFTALLRHGKLTWVESSTIKARQVCDIRETGWWWMRTPTSFLVNYPACDDD